MLGKCKDAFGKCEGVFGICMGAFEKCKDAVGKCKERCGTSSGSAFQCPSNAVVNILSFVHLASKPALLIVNIAYLASLGLHTSTGKDGQTLDIIGTDPATDLKATGAAFANIITFAILIQEIVVIIIFPIVSIVQWVFCWKKSCSMKFLEYWRFGDLSYAFILAPFSNIDFFYVGGWWYIAIIARLAFYSVTFAVAVIGGLRFIYSFYCVICCECASNEDSVELKGCKHLFLDIGVKMVSIALKLLTCSSALSTYLKTGILVNSIGFRAAYFSFSMLRGVTALFSLVFASAMLRWAALKDSEQESGSRWSMRLGWLNRHEPHVHVSFFLDMLSYIGLLVLNFIIVHGIRNEGFDI